MALPGPARMRGRFTDHSGTITNGGTAQPLMGDNADRNFLLIQNQHASADLWVDFAVVAVTSQPSIRIAAGTTLRFDGTYLPIESISIIGGTTSQPFAVKEG